MSDADGLCPESFIVFFLVLNREKCLLNREKCFIYMTSSEGDDRTGYISCTFLHLWVLRFQYQFEDRFSFVTEAVIILIIKFASVIWSVS